MKAKDLINSDFNRKMVKAPKGKFKIKAFAIISGKTTKMAIENIPTKEAMRFIKYVYKSMKRSKTIN